MKLDFRKVKVTGIDGDVIEMDFSKDIGNMIFRTTKDLGELETARTIYQKGFIDADKPTSDLIKRHIDENFVAFAKEALYPMFAENKK